MEPERIQTLEELAKQLDTPNPVTPLPFERFSHLKDSEDMMNKAAFWCFYAAWLHDQQTQHTNTVSVEARNDAHTFVALQQNLHLRDCVIIRRDELAHLVQHAHRNGPHVMIVATSSALLGMVVTLLLVLIYGV